MVGFLLGAIAGWLNGGKIDRFLLGLSETIAAYPTLILAMILIIGFDIRLGMKPFIIALSIVGWGEVMQYVRAEVMSADKNGCMTAPSITECDKPMK